MKLYKLNSHSTASHPTQYVLVLAESMREAIAAAHREHQDVMWGTSIPMRDARADETLIEA
ncbi:hypothetical protein SAMN04487788_1931 [Microbacterium testaceum StLB037]|uniref:Uncharacterized protein n=1 Tax=Microbacterium testaceum (strain StLB037) TaxID=979556 RepID=A0A1H0PPE7_MICTS|nr:hypothetical protein [Microbacterium testaceum]SDP07031.1 hypothetical protein SAMN04487788_1931 [Microbacterium testaceum StLB037]